MDRSHLSRAATRLRAIFYLVAIAFCSLLGIPIRTAGAFLYAYRMLNHFAYDLTVYKDYRPALHQLIDQT